jgi:isopenicillin-N N-acyltransferase-like protein
LRESNVTDALTAATKTPRIGSTNLIISHKDGFAVDLETRPHTARWLHPEDGWLAHTNHFLSEIPPEIADTYEPEANSIVRYGRMTQLMRQAVARGGIAFEDLVMALKDHRFSDGEGICTHAQPDDAPEDAWESVASVITNLTTGVMSVSSGPPCMGKYVDIEISSGKSLGLSQSNAIT